MDSFRIGGHREATSWDLFDHCISFKNHKGKRRLKKICTKKGRVYLKKITKAEIESETNL